MSDPTERIGSFLANLGLEQYTSCFDTAGCDTVARLCLFEWTPKRLDRIGVTAPDDQQLLLTILASMNTPAKPAAAATASATASIVTTAAALVPASSAVAVPPLARAGSSSASTGTAAAAATATTAAASGEAPPVRRAPSASEFSALLASSSTTPSTSPAFYHSLTGTLIWLPYELVRLILTYLSAPTLIVHSSVYSNLLLFDITNPVSLHLSGALCGPVPRNGTLVSTAPNHHDQRVVVHDDPTVVVWDVHKKLRTWSWRAPGIRVWNWLHSNMAVTCGRSKCMIFDLSPPNPNAASATAAGSDAAATVGVDDVAKPTLTRTGSAGTAGYGFGTGGGGSTAGTTLHYGEPKVYALCNTSDDVTHQMLSVCVIPRTMNVAVVSLYVKPTQVPAAMEVLYTKPLRVRVYAIAEDDASSHTLLADYSFTSNLAFSGRVVLNTYSHWNQMVSSRIMLVGDTFEVQAIDVLAGTEIGRQTLPHDSIAIVEMGTDASDYSIAAASATGNKSKSLSALIERCPVIAVHNLGRVLFFRVRTERPLVDMRGNSEKLLTPVYNRVLESGADIRWGGSQSRITSMRVTTRVEDDVPFVITGHNSLESIHVWGLADGTHKASFNLRAGSIALETSS